MTKIYTVYEGEYTTRRTEKFRQVNQGIQELLDHGVSEKEVSQEATGNHEKAHVLGHPPGRTGRIVARVFVNRHQRIEGWSIQHQVKLDEKSSMSGREVVGGCLAPAFVRGKKCDPLSVIDIASAAAGGVVVGLETVINARKVIRHKLNLLP